MAKKILGLDLGTTSIGWAYVHEGNTSEESEIIQIGSRVIPLTTDEETNFEKGKPITTNHERTLKRGARRNLDRYQSRRKFLIEALKQAHIIHKDSNLNETGKNSTFETWRLRSKAVTDRIEKEEFARVLLAINKKRGYKSSRKAKNEDEGQLIDGMGVAKKLYEENLTPGQFCYRLLLNKKTTLPDFYRSDLRDEFDRIWEFQKQYHSQILTDDFYEELKGKGQRATATAFWRIYGFNTADIKDLDDDLKNRGFGKLDKRRQKRLQAYKWRSIALSKPLEKEQMAYVLTEVNNNLNNSSGYLGAISDRSKKLFFNKETVGQFLYKQLQKNPHAQLKDQVFYRQDYMDEFEVIWETQAKFYPELTKDLKAKIRDIIIFYQRKLKSQKGLISFCEFENREIQIDGKKKMVGLRVVPKSSPLFQEFKIWQNLNSIVVRKKGDVKKRYEPNLDFEAKKFLFEELNLKGKLTANRALKLLGYSDKEWQINYKVLQGNETNRTLYDAYLQIIYEEGYDVKELLKVNSSKDEVKLSDLKIPAIEIKRFVKGIFESLGINTAILDFDAELEGKAFERQKSYQLWHLLYSAEDDIKEQREEDRLQYGNNNIILKKQLYEKFGFNPEQTKILANVIFQQDDYGSLSTKAIRKIYPFLKEHEYSEACTYAGYKHSKHSLTKVEIENRVLKDTLDLLPKNSLRNPVVEKILNQMINLINALIEKYSKKDEDGNIVEYFRFDEICVELARELKQSAAEREIATKGINDATRRNDKIRDVLQKEFGIPNPTRNDVVRYRLYQELKNNGYRDLYTNKYIPQEKLYSKEVDIEHIIPQSKMFDDSFSNKTVVYRKDNLKKGNKTAYDYILDEFGEKGLKEYMLRIETLFDYGKKSQESGINKAKFLKLQKREADIGDGFIERDLRNTQYIAKKAKEILFGITKTVVSTSGRITDRLREDWDLISVMKELNLPKYRALGLTEMEERKYKHRVEVIKDWSKRNDHRHHAMDALTVAFTKHVHIQYLNYLNARKDESHKQHSNVIAIQKSETTLKENNNGGKRRVFKEPLIDFRRQAKEHLESVLISHKAKNKVVTRNKNKIRRGNGYLTKTELTPRGQLHKETIYGKYHYYQTKIEKIGTKFDEKKIKQVANPVYRELLGKRLKENNNNPKKAFGGKNALSKNPIYISLSKNIKVPGSVKTVQLVTDFSIRKEVSPDNFKNEKAINKVLDKKVRDILIERLREFGGDAKKAFSDLDQNPIWFNKEKEIVIKRVKITGVSNATPLHHKKDHFGEFILDENGNQIPADYISTGNNHHVAIYRDQNGKLQESIVSFFEAVERVNQNLPVIDKTYRQSEGWEFLFTMKQNEMFVFPNETTGFDPLEIDLLNPKNKKEISSNLFRVQKITTKDYFFRHHLETTVENSSGLKNVSWRRTGLSGIEEMIKVRINHLGDIVEVGEY